MSEDIFDAIIVGAGLAGSVAALVLAREGAQVLVIERGNSAGAKNVTGGRLYAHSLEHIIPGFADSAPVERLITHEKLAFMTEKSAMTMDYCNGDETSPSQRSYSVLRSKFDAWLMEQAEEAGAQLITGIRVDNLVQRDGKVVGVEADGDVIEAKTVILADGVNSILAEKLGMAKRVKPTDVAVGVKELIELPKSVIEDRFQLQGNQGAACLFAGSPTDGLMGGGFLYTNENTLSLGLVCGLHHLHDAKKSVPQMLEDFKQHPAVAPLIAGGKLVEYSAHVVPEAGINMLPELVGDGVLIAGDAAGMCMNLGFTIRGMDLAIAAGEAAAKTVLSAMKSDDFSKQKLAEYRQHLESGPLRDMRMYQKLPAFLDNPRMFSGYPELAVGVARDLFTIDGSAPELMRKKILRHGKKVGFINLIKDGMKGVTVLTSPVNVDVKLGVNKFNVDEEHPHIVVKADADKQALELLVKACPAGLYKKQDDGSVRFDYAGCLECGTCRILGLGSALEQWEYPRGTFGVEFRYG